VTPVQFQHALLAWFDRHGRNHLPWQQDINPYRVWVSEIMLQQTQVMTVIPYYLKFMARFPDVNALSTATIDDVLTYWAGLGYYARARNLHKAAKIIYDRGYFPDTLEELIALPGIGRSTAGAILCIAFDKPHPILDGNVKRVLTRFCAVSYLTGSNQAQKQLWEISTQFTAVARIADYTQAIMDLGATICTRTKPACDKCPLSSGCKAFLLQTPTAYPVLRITKPLPTKNLIFLLAHTEQQVLLEKRPPTGIWGGLWSLPEFQDEPSAIDWCVMNNLSMEEKRLGNQQRHTFSHYHLNYRALIVKTHDITHVIQETEKLSWHNNAQINHLGLSVPIKQLLNFHLT
jgi:A/G-specific adenine glycosylase